jgi:hypothetical protein
MILRACINLHSNYSRKNLPSDQVSRRSGSGATELSETERNKCTNMNGRVLAPLVRGKLENNNTARVFLAEYVGPDAGAEVARRKLAQFQEESTYIF